MGGHTRGEHADRDLKRRQLARRLLAHQARTQTIFDLTFLTRHQLATLRHRWGVTKDTRRRGPSPKSFAVFWSSARVRCESAALAVLYDVLSAVSLPDDSRARKRNFSIDTGELLCEVFEAYSTCFPRSGLEFEQLVLLARGLAQGDVITIGNCSSCDSAILIDLLANRRNVCDLTSSEQHSTSENELSVSVVNEPGFAQGELF